jgi:GNAT superfamily N-acetyltransferase
VKKYDTFVLGHVPITECQCEDIAHLLSRLRKPTESQVIITRETIERVIDDDSVHVVYAKDTEGAIIGIASMSIHFHLTHGRVAFIDSVSVHKSHERKGIARQLMTQLIGVARQGGVTRIRLTSKRFRTSAHALYRSLSFVENNTVVMDLHLT